MQKPRNISSRQATFELLPVQADSVIRRFTGSHHCHCHMELWYVFEGEMIHTIGDDVYVQKPGNLAVVPAYITHRTDTSRSEETPVIFSASADEYSLRRRGYDCFLRHSKIIAFEGKQLPIFCELHGKQREQAESLARQILNEDFRKAPDSPDVRCRLFADFLRVITLDSPALKTSRALRDRTDAISSASDYIALHYNEKIPLDMLAENAIMSKRRFTENFKSVTGKTVGEVIHLYRMSRADQLLIFSDKTLDEIAAELGFYDKSSFSHAFVAHYGVTPDTHRRKNREKSYAFELNEKLKRSRRYETLNYYYSLMHNGEQLSKSIVTNMPNLI